jgi:hypothetical protein
VYRVRAHSGCIQGVLHDPRDYISSRHILVRVSILFKLFCQEQFTDRPVYKTPTRVLNQSSVVFQIVFLFVSSIRRQGLALMARSIVQRMVDNQRRSGAAIAGFESC